MSLLDLASLVLAPTATKEGKVYSAIPDTGEGDMTFTRGSSATRVNSAGLIEKERGNYVLQSNQFNTGWTSINSTETGGQSGYDGSSDAWLLSKTASDGRLAQLITTGGVQTASVYAKAGTLDWILLLCASNSGNAYLYFDLANGVKGTDGANTIDSTITSVGGGWYRISITFDRTLSACRFYPADGDGDTSGTSGSIYIQDAMLNEGLVATDYIETTTSAVYEGITDDVPRVDYSGGGCPSLLLESQRTNLVTQSEYFGAWTNDTNTILTSNAITSPSGLVDAYKMSAGTSTARQGIKVDLTPSGDVVQSVFAKKGEYSVIQITDARNPNLYANFDVENGVLGNYEDCTPSIEEFNDGWYRCVITYNSTLSIVSTRISIAESTTQARLVNFAGNGSDGIYIWGAMVEAGTYSTSYIPTYSVSSTRVVDSCSKTGISELIGQSEGTLFVEVSGLSNDTVRFAISDGTNNNNLYIELSSSGIAAVGRVSAVNQFAMSSSQTITNLNKIAVKYKENDFALWINGVEVGTDSSGSTYSANTLNAVKFDRGDGGIPFYGNMEQMILFPTALTDTQLEELTK